MKQVPRFLSAALATGLGFALALFGIHFALIGQPQTERLQWTLFEIGWLTVPVLSTAFATWVTRHPSIAPSPAFLWRAVFYQLLPLCALIPWFRSAMGAPTWTGCILALGFYAIAVFIPLRYRAPTPALYWLPILWALILLESLVSRYSPLPADSVALGPIHFDYRALGLAAFCTWLLEKGPRRKAKSAHWVSFVTGALLAAFLLARLDLPIELQHLNFYLGPVNDVVHGKTVLVDSVSQYGVGVIYFLAAVFTTALQPPSYAGLTVILGVLIWFEYFALYSLLRRALRSTLWSCVALLAVLGVNYFAGFSSLLYFPAAGPLRFGLPIAIIFFLSLKRDYWAFALFGLASVWSLETFIYSAAAVVGWHCVRGRFWLRFKNGLKRGVVACLLAHALVVVFTYLRSGQLPHWDYYFPYLVAYTPAGGVGIETGFHWDEWILVSLVYFASLIGCFFFSSRRMALISSFTFLGLAQFTYYLGQTHPSYLTRCCIPAVVLIFLWHHRLLRASHSDSPGLIRSAHWVGFSLLFVLFFQVRYRIWNTRVYHGPLASWSCIHSPCPTGERTAVLADLIRKHARPGRIGLFLSQENETVETLLLTRRAHEWPLGEIRQDLLVPIGMQRISSHRPSLKQGDVFFVDQPVWNQSLKPGTARVFTPTPLGYDFLQVLETQAALVRNLCQQFRCEITQTALSFSAVELQPKN